MKTLLTATTLIELGAGAALLFFPSGFVAILTGLPLEGHAAFPAVRIGGAGLLALSVACWFARDDMRSRAASGLVAAMLLYNIATVGILALAGISSGLHAVALWPGVVLHAAMTVWCIACLRRVPKMWR